MNRGSNKRNETFILQRYPGFKYCHLPEAALFVIQLLAICHFQQILDKLFEQLFHCFSFEQRTGIKVYPVSFLLEEGGVGRYFHGRNKAAKRGAAAGCEED